MTGVVTPQRATCLTGAKTNFHQRRRAGRLARSDTVSSPILIKHKALRSVSGVTQLRRDFVAVQGHLTEFRTLSIVLSRPEKSLPTSTAPGGSPRTGWRMWPSSSTWKQSSTSLTWSSPSRLSGRPPCTSRSPTIGGKHGRWPGISRQTVKSRFRMSTKELQGIWTRPFARQGIQRLCLVPWARSSTVCSLPTSTSTVLDSIPTPRRCKICWRPPTWGSGWTSFTLWVMKTLKLTDWKSRQVLIKVPIFFPS